MAPADVAAIEFTLHDLQQAETMLQTAFAITPDDVESVLHSHTHRIIKARGLSIDALAADVFKAKRPFKLIGRKMKEKVVVAVCRLVF